MALITRRSLLTGLIAAPAVVAASSLMPVRAIEPLWMPHPFREFVYVRWCDGSLERIALRPEKYDSEYFSFDGVFAT